MRITDVAPWVVENPPPTSVPLEHEAVDVANEPGLMLTTLPFAVVTVAFVGAPVRQTAVALNPWLEPLLFRAATCQPLPLLAFFETAKLELTARPPPTTSVANGQVAVAVPFVFGASVVVTWTTSVFTHAKPLQGGLAPSTTLGSRPRPTCRAHSLGNHVPCWPFNDSVACDGSFVTRLVGT